MPIHPTVVLMDFETANPDSTLLERSGAWVYSEHVCTEILCLVYAVDGHTYTWTPEHRERGDHLRSLARAEDVRFVRHGDFELAIWRNIMVAQLDFPPLAIDRWADTMATAAVKALPLSLERLATELNIGIEKDMEGRKHTLGLSKPNKEGMLDRSGEALERVVDYCTRDVEAELAVDAKLGPMPEDERQAWLLHQRMNARGLRLDLAYIAACQQVVDKASVPLVARFREITGFNPSQVAKVRDWCAWQGVELPNLTAETVADVLGGSVDEDDEAESGTITDVVTLPANVRDALSIRQLVGSASVKKLGRMAACVCADGRSRGCSMFHGAGPGRSTGRLWQPLNFPRGTLIIDGKPPDPELVVETIMSGDPDYVQMVLGDPIQAVVSGLRHAIIADPGHELLSGDYAGIQARIVLALAGETEKTALMAAGADVYCDMASQIYSRPITKADKIERQVGKNAVLGLGFGMGWKKFKAKYGKHLTDEFCQEVVRVYRRVWAPRVPWLWSELNAVCLETVHPGITELRRTRRQEMDKAIELRWGKVVNTAGKRWTYTKQLEYALDNCRQRRIAFSRLSATEMAVVLPSKRKLWYGGLRIDHEDRWIALVDGKLAQFMHLEDVPDGSQHEAINDWHPVVTYSVVKNGIKKQESLHGARLTENIVMGIEVDIMRHGWKTAVANGFEIVHECYDELVAEVPVCKDKQKLKETFRNCLLDKPDWLPPLNIPVDVPLDDIWVGKRYRK